MLEYIVALVLAFEAHRVLDIIALCCRSKRIDVRLGNIRSPLLVKALGFPRTIDELDVISVSSFLDHIFIMQVEMIFDILDLRRAVIDLACISVRINAKLLRIDLAVRDLIVVIAAIGLPCAFICSSIPQT